MRWEEYLFRLSQYTAILDGMTSTETPKAIRPKYTQITACPNCGYSGRYPLSPVETYLGTTEAKVIAKRVNMGWRQIYKAREYGFSLKQADHVAAELRIHMSMLWPYDATDLEGS